jgi:hypothetical protein
LQEGRGGGVQNPLAAAPANDLPGIIPIEAPLPPPRVEAPPSSSQVCMMNIDSLFVVVFVFVLSLFFVFVFAFAVVVAIIIAIVIVIVIVTVAVFVAVFVVAFVFGTLLGTVLTTSIVSPLCSTFDTAHKQPHGLSVK